MVFFCVVDGECLLPPLPPLLFFGYTLLGLRFCILVFSGVKSPLSMDEVLRKRYRGKLDCRVVYLVERLPPPSRIDHLFLSAASPTSPMDGGGSSSEVNPLSTLLISTIMPLGGVRPSSTESSEDTNEGIIFDVRHMQAKMKAIMARGKPVTGAPNITK